MKEIEKVLNLFKSKPYLVIMGAKKISKRYEVSIESIMEARKIIQ